MQNLVIVSSPTLTNCSIPIIIEELKVRIGENVETRPRSRKYVFQDYKAQIPFQYVPMLKKQRGEEFKVEGVVPVDESILSDAEKREYDVLQEKVQMYMDNESVVEKCPYCDEVFKGKNPVLSITNHVRQIHKDKYEEWKKERKK
jgi:uncharacterized C2H2 Zn-finger protein